MTSNVSRGMLVIGLMVLLLQGLQAETISECQTLFRTGKYDECLAATTKAIETKSYGEDWPLLKAQCELTLGKYPEALATTVAGLDRYNWSVRLLMMRRTAALANGQKELADESLKAIVDLVSTSSWRYTDADDLVVLGQASLILGADPRDVQEGFFERARRNFKNRPDGFLAAGQLALDKGDLKLAGEILGPAAKSFPDDPEIQFAWSEAIRGTNRETGTAALKRGARDQSAIRPSDLSCCRTAD